MILLRIWLWVNSHTSLLSDVYNRAEIDFHNCQSVQMQMNYNAARLDISHIILKIVNNALLKCKILHIKTKRKNISLILHIIETPVCLRKSHLKVLSYVLLFAILLFCNSVSLIY